MCVTPNSDNIGKDLGQPPGRPPGSPCNQNDDVRKNDYSEEKKENENDYSEKNKNDNYDEHVPFNHHRYPDGQHGAIYMKPPLLPPRNCTHDRKHQKKKFSRSRSVKPNKLNLISPLPDFQLNSLHY